MSECGKDPAQKGLKQRSARDRMTLKMAGGLLEGIL